jgi:hypothetical protein
MARWRRGGTWPKSASVDPLSQHIERASLGYFDRATIFICARVKPSGRLKGGVANIGWPS